MNLRLQNRSGTCRSPEVGVVDTVELTKDLRIQKSRREALGGSMGGFQHQSGSDAGYWTTRPVSGSGSAVQNLNKQHLVRNGGRSKRSLTSESPTKKNVWRKTGRRCSMPKCNSGNYLRGQTKLRHQLSKRCK